MEHENNEEQFDILIIISIIRKEELKIFLNLYNFFYSQRTTS